MFWRKKKPQHPAPAAPPPSAATTQPPALPASPPPTTSGPMKLGKGHPGTFEGPVNRLEETLMAYRNREVTIFDFLDEFLNSEVYVLPMEEDIVTTDGARRLSPTPTLFCMNYPDFSALAVYTDRERIPPTFKLHPEFRYAAKVHAGKFLTKLQGNFGVVINPYWDINIEWTNAQFREILRNIQLG